LRLLKARGFAAPLLIAALGTAPGGVDRVPLFAQFATEDPALRSYSVPLHVSVAIHKLFTFHFGLNGMVYFRRPGSLAMSMEKVPDKYQRLFSRLGTPRTWPQTYELHVVRTDRTKDGQTVYRVRGVPLETCDIDHMVADIGPASAPVKATWFLRDGGTIAATIESASVDNYLVPTAEHADIDAGGFKIHADLTYGDYDLNTRVSEAVF
jgi:hypothetical protein